MPVDLGLDSIIARIRAVDENSTGFADALGEFVDSFLSTANRFNSAATRVVGTAGGQVPELGSDGKLPRSTIPSASQTAAGGVRLATATEHVLESPSTTLAATPGGVRSLVDSRARDALLPSAGWTGAGTYTWRFAPLGRSALVFLTGGGGGASFNRANGGGGAGATTLGVVRRADSVEWTVVVGAGGESGVFDSSPDPDNERDEGVGPANNGAAGANSTIAPSGGAAVLTAAGGNGSSGVAGDSRGGMVSTVNNSASFMGVPGGDGQPNLRFIGGASFWGGAGRAPGAGGYLTADGVDGGALILQFG